MTSIEGTNFPKLIDYTEQLEKIRNTWSKKDFHEIDDSLEKVLKIANSETFKPFATPFLSKTRQLREKIEIDYLNLLKVKPQFFKELNELNTLVAKVTHGILRIPIEADEKTTAEIFKNLHIIQDLIEKKKFAEILQKLGNEIPTSEIIETLIEPYSEELIKAAQDKTVKTQESFDIKKLLKMPGELRELILKSLSNEDLKKMEIALAKQNHIPQDQKSAMEHLAKILPEIIHKRIFQEILNDHLKWKKMIDTWHNVSLEDKIWLIRLYELRSIGIKIPEIDELHHPNKHLVPREFSPKLLEKKNEIQKVLGELKTLILSGANIDKCPSSICLLTNLENLFISNSSITKPPDLRPFPKLHTLDLPYNRLNEPPDVRWNPKLTSLNLVSNQLKKGPDLSKNPRMKYLNLSANKLEERPQNMETHPNLQVVL